VKEEIFTPTHIIAEMIFSNILDGFWDDEDNVIMFMDWLCSQLQVIHPFDWYNISNEVIERHGGAGLLLKYGGKYNLLASVYPYYHWDVNKFHISSQKTQHHLHNIVQNMFPSYKVLINSKPTELQSHHSGARMELDVYIPLLSLAFEYQCLLTDLIYTFRARIILGICLLIVPQKINKEMIKINEVFVMIRNHID